ncbi:hypothetical protein ACGFYU_17570 [Streptomyces sp. NPDC048337]|uniref:hypothetical protein n=1 Tax=Streptomyces sp. NPDC048337 TaxID=3365535 RepID=UPI00371B8221
MEPKTTSQRGVKNLPKTPDGPWPIPWGRSELSQELLDRALAGWERFVSSIQEPSDG